MAQPRSVTAAVEALYALIFRIDFRCDLYFMGLCHRYLLAGNQTHRLLAVVRVSGGNAIRQGYSKARILQFHDPHIGQITGICPCIRIIVVGNRNCFAIFLQIYGRCLKRRCLNINFFACAIKRLINRPITICDIKVVLRTCTRLDRIVKNERIITPCNGLVDRNGYCQRWTWTERTLRVHCCLQKPFRLCFVLQ